MSIYDFGVRLKALRKDKNMTQVELARRLGLTKGSISGYEKASKLPSVEVLVQLCQIFEVSSDYLLGLTETFTVEMGGLTDEQTQSFLHLISIVEKYNEIKEK
jgi:transcriptional regulator with XRE-family HTH domain